MTPLRSLYSQWTSPRRRDTSDERMSYNTKFNALGTLESGSSIRDLIEILGIGETNRPFATAEKLAELGVTKLARRLGGSKSLADIMTEVSA
jgi:hypothetical protein